MKKQSDLRTIRFDDELTEQYGDAPLSYYLYRIVGSDELVQVEMAFGEQLERQGPGGYIKISENQDAVRCLAEELDRDGLQPRCKTTQKLRARWPQTSWNAGVNPSQIGELRDFWREHDVRGCEVLPNGDVVYQDRAARKSDHAARGLFDRDAGYGDQAPQHR